MEQSERHELLGRLGPDCCIAALASGDVRAKVLEAIRREDTLRRRASPLSPSCVAWLVLGLALHRSLSVQDVLARLLSQLPEAGLLPRRPVTDSALAHARERLGVAPFRALFDDVRREGPEPSFHGRRVAALDAVVFSVPDTPANAAHFGRHRPKGRRAPYPQLRLATLTWTRTRRIASAKWVSIQKSEQGPCEEIARETLLAGDLVLMDRGLASYRFCAQLAARGVDYVARIRRSAKPQKKKRVGPGDYDVEHRRRVKKGEPSQAPPVFGARLIEFHVRGERVRLLTSLTDRAITPQEIAQLYLERWEVELSYDELKTHLAALTKGSPDVPLRGRSPQMVEQELFAMLCTYNLVRRLIETAARRRGVDPRLISFVGALHRVQDGGRPFTAAGYLSLLDDLADLVLRRPRRSRRCPRAQKRISRYSRKRPRARCSEVAPARITFR